MAKLIYDCQFLVSMLSRVFYFGSRFCVALAIILKLFNKANTGQFVLACIGLVPLAGMIGDATEKLGRRIGSIGGGILSASFGNAPELIFSIISLYKGNLDELIKASLLGSVISNILLVLGTSFIVGGYKNGTQEFEKGIIHSAGSTLLIFASFCLSIPTIWKATVQHEGVNATPTTLNMLVAIVLILCYILYTFFQIQDDLKKEREPLHTLEVNTSGLYVATTEYDLEIEHEQPDPEAQQESTNGSVIYPILQLLISSCLVAVLSDIITDTVSDVASNLGLSQIFIGAVIISVTGNAAEHWTALQASYHNETDLAVTTVLTSALQISMLIIPVLTILSTGRSNDLFQLTFNPIELVINAVTVLVAWLIIEDTKTNWIEGVALLGTYVISCTVFYYT